MSRDRETRADDEASLRAAYTVLAKAPSAPCPSPEALAGLATGEVSGIERQGLADHVVVCASCAADWRILSETHRARDTSRRKAYAVAAAAAALVLGIILWRGGGLDSDVVRGQRAPDSSGAAPPAGSRLDAAPREFSWTAPDGASRHRFKLFDASGKVVWQNESGREARAALPEAVRTTLTPGAYFWTVEVETPSGTEKLGPFPFDVARR